MILRLLVAGAALLFLFMEDRLGPLAPFVKMIPVAALAVLVHRSGDRAGKPSAIAGLLTSAIADAAIEYRFLYGLATFLVAHLFYIAAFTKAEPRRRWVRLVPVAIWAALALPPLSRGAGDLRVPVILYGLAIFVMIWRAAAALGSGPGRHAGAMGLAGAILFGVSDTLLAYNRFVSSVPASDVLILGTYWGAQTLIAMSFIRSK